MEGEVAISSRHFFKVMMPGFKDELILPRSVCKKLKQVNMMKLVAILKSGKESWKIDQVCRSNNEDGVMCLKGEGWTQFVNHHKLCIADFLVFEYNINITTTAPQLHLNLLLFHTSSASEKDFLLHSRYKHRHHHSTNTTTSTRESDKDSVESYRTQNSEFFLTMKPSHACKHAPKVTIPAEFVRWNNLSKISRITLRDPYGIAWPVKLVYETIGKFPLRMGNGWPDFYESNNLKNGDICRFQLNPCLLKSKTVVFDVKIFPAKANNPNTSTGDKSGKDTVDASCRSRNSEFVLTMKPSYAYKYATHVTIPAQFMRSNNLSKKSHIILRDPHGRAWPVKLMLQTVGQFRLGMGKGWRGFYVSNKLKNGDVCRFQLNRSSLKSKTVVFDVNISPAKANNNKTRESDEDSVEPYRSQNSEFVLTMKPSHAYKHAPKVTIPAQFVRSNNLSKKTEITLRDPNGRAWPVKLILQTVGQFRLRMGKGWAEFYESNNLKNGDLCRFQLNRRSLKSKTAVFDVKIFPS